MKKKKLLLVFNIVTIFCLIIAIFLMYHEDNTEVILSRKINNSDKQLSLMLETDYKSNEYQESEELWPTEGYQLNQSLSACENGGAITYNSDKKTIEVSTVHSEKCYIYFDKNPITAVDAILKNKVNNGTPNFEIIATTDEGLYKTNDDLGTSYYFRGAVKNNYVEFGNILWRIIRINGDNTVRMIYEKKLISSDYDIPVGKIPSSYCQISLYGGSIDDPYTKHTGIGYMYYAESEFGKNCLDISNNEETTSSGAPRFSDAATKLNQWFLNWTSNNTDLSITNKLADTIFCNDISIGNFPPDTPYRENWYRITANKNPSLECRYNRYTTKNSDELLNSDERWVDTTKLLDYPIGLITADEVAMAGGVEHENNNEYYLSFGSPYYTMSLKGISNDGNIFENSSCSSTSCSSSSCSSSNTSCSSSSDDNWGHYLLGSDYYLVSDSGNIESSTGNYNLRPVINIKGNVYFSGQGTKENPYKVQD